MNPQYEMFAQHYAYCQKCERKVSAGETRKGTGTRMYHIECGNRVRTRPKFTIYPEYWGKDGDSRPRE